MGSLGVKKSSSMGYLRCTLGNGFWALGFDAPEVPLGEDSELPAGFGVSDLVLGEDFEVLDGFGVSELM